MATKRRGGPFKRPAFGAKWHTLQTPDGKTVKVQGSYEAAYAKYLIDNGIKFKAQPKPALRYIDRFGGTHSYTPDFWVDGIGYVEIKSLYTLKRGAKKLEDVAKSGHIITIYTEVELAALGINVRGSNGTRKRKEQKDGKDKGRGQGGPKGGTEESHPVDAAGGQKRRSNSRRSRTCD